MSTRLVKDSSHRSGSWRPRRRFNSLAVAIGAILVTAFAGPPVASAQVVVSGSAWLSGAGVPVCYPVGQSCPGVTIAPGETTNDWQCVELAARLYEAKHWISRNLLVLYAGAMNASWAASYGLQFHNNGSGYVPVPGDLIVLAGDPGHVSVVAQPVSPSSGLIHTVEENYSSTGKADYALSGSTISRPNDGRAVLGIIHAPADPFTNSGSGGKAVHTAAALIPNEGASGYVLDGYGGLHSFGNAPSVTSPTTWPGWDIARAIAVVARGKGYILDGYGGLHAFGGAPYLSDNVYWGWDIARGVALCRGGAGGYVLDGWGGIHPIGNAQALSGGPYWPNWDIARGIVVNSTCAGGYVLDGYGGVHPFGNASAVNLSAYWGGWDIARSIALVTDNSGYVLDGYGGIHPFAASGVALPPVLSDPLYDEAASNPFDAFVYSTSAKAGLAVTQGDSNALFYEAAVS
jgi:CHAP domain